MEVKAFVVKEEKEDLDIFPGKKHKLRKSKKEVEIARYALKGNKRFIVADTSNWNWPRCKICQKQLGPKVYIFIVNSCELSYNNNSTRINLNDNLHLRYAGKKALTI